MCARAVGRNGAAYSRKLPVSFDGIMALRSRMTNNSKSVYFALLRSTCSSMARWQSGNAADCKSVNAGSIPTRASILNRHSRALSPLSGTTIVSQSPSTEFEKRRPNVAALLWLASTACRSAQSSGECFSGLGNVARFADFCQRSFHRYQSSIPSHKERVDWRYRPVYLQAVF